MAKWWWPWGRPNDPQPEATAAHLPTEPTATPRRAVQRTIGEITPTAHLKGFATTLTTSQNPTLVRPPELLAAEQSDRLAVLQLASAKSGSTPPVAPAPATPQSRTWAPSAIALQRILRHGEIPVQRSADTAPPVRQAHAVVAPGPAAPLSMVQAPQPDDLRPLDTAGVAELPTAQTWPTESLAAAPDLGRENPTADPTPEVATESEAATESDHVPTVQHAPTPVQRASSDAPIPSVPHPISPSSPSQSLSLAPRHLPSVTRPRVPSERSTAPAPVHVLRVIDPAAPDDRSGTVDPGALTTAAGDYTPNIAAASVDVQHTVPPVDRSAPEHGLPLMRTAETAELPAAAPVTAAAQPTTPAAGAPERPPAALQRIPAGTSERTPVAATQPTAPAAGVPEHAAAAMQPIPAGTPARTPAAAVQQPMATVVGPAMATPSHAVGVQRLPVIKSPIDVPDAAARQDTQPVVSPDPQRPPESPGRPSDGVDAYAEAPPRLPPVRDPRPVVTTYPAALQRQTVTTIGAPTRQGEGDPGPPPAAAANHAVVQRDTRPGVGRPITAQRAESPYRSTDPAVPDRSIVQHGPARGRLVVLPPLRSSADGDEAPVSLPNTAQRSVVVENARPVGLQRMFENTSGRTERTTSSTPSLTSGDAAAAHSYSPGPVPASLNDYPPGPTYDEATNTITFAPPSVQRDAADASAPAPSEPSATPAPVPAMTVTPAAPAPSAAGGDVDELVNRLYDPLVARLRAELWQDRERAGVLMDLGR